MALFKTLLLAFVAGAAGALANSLAVWAFGASGLTPLLGTRLTPPLTLGWVLPRLFFGGLWGLLFLLPGLPAGMHRRALLVSLAPTAYMLFKVFPQQGQGLMGLALGPTVPLFVIFFNYVWGIAGLATLRALGSPRQQG